jgi:alpha-tubulin suppressor-like RCC1 family protein
VKKFSHIITLSSYVALACGSTLMNTGCGTTSIEKVGSSQISLEIRFQDDDAATQQPSAGLLRLASAAVGPTTHDQVARILVDITVAESGQPFFLNFDLTQIATDVWRGDVPLLPRNQQLRFAARALSATGEVAFSGDTVATLAVDNQSLQIPLAPAQNNQTFQMPRMFRIAYPGEIFAGAEEQIAFTILGNAGAAIGIQITPLGSPMTPAPEFSPASGTVTLTNTVADFMTVYTAPDVTTDTDLDYQVTITDARAQTAVAITTNFRTHIIPRSPGTPIVHNIHPGVLFNPVILSLTANGSETPGTVELVADVSDASAPDRLVFQWSYAPNGGTPDATFDNNGQSDPGLFQGYSVAHEGTITLAVTDEHGGTTTLHYPLARNQFADAIDHASVGGLKRIVSGLAHTCVLTGQSRVRCWGDNEFGQLGYGNVIDVGDNPTRLPYAAGDVPLPVDPMTHLPLDPVMQLVAGHNHTCVLLESGLVTCWGDNRFGQLGYNRTDNLADDEAVTSFGYVTVGDLATRIAAGGDHTCAILQSGAVRCWGRNDFGQLGRGNTATIGDNETVFSAGNVDLGAGVIVKDLALGDSHTCVLLTTGAVRCWGRNDVGQLGYGNSTNLGDNEPINNLPDVSLTGTVRKLVAGNAHTCALTFAGTLRCWGDDFFGQLGQGFGGGNRGWGDQANELPSTLPGDINTGAQVTDVTAGGFHTCALSSDGQLKCWGRNDFGELGYGFIGHQAAPPATGVNLDGVTAYSITAGNVHTCALRSNGTARCWGLGNDGRLGRGSTATSATATGNVDIQIFALLTVGGTVSDLGPGQSVVLQNNGTNNLTVSANGSFTFTSSTASGATYDVTVLANPPGRACIVANGSGTVAASNVTNVTVNCSTTGSFTISPAVNGKTSWDLATDGSLVLGSAGTWTLTVSSAFTATAKAWGAGGAGGNPSRTETANGGGGGFASGTLTLNSGDRIVIVVGGGGAASGAGGSGGGGASDRTYGGGGGGSFITFGGMDQIVGGGGGGGGYDYAGAAGGGTTGGRNPGDGGGGGGGTQTAGGAGAGNLPGNPGTFHQGGNSTYYGGGGGGGYYGGAGGGTTSGYGNGGGGGSSYVGGSRVTNGSTTGGSAATPGGVGDPDHAGGAGRGGAGTTTSTGTNGNPGRVVIVGSGEQHSDPNSDPNISSVVLLLHMNGADGSTTFTDVKGHAFTPAGNAKISTTTSKFGGASGYFDGTGGYVSTSASVDFDFNGTGPFTIEAWVNGTGTFWSNDWYGLVLSIKNGTELRLWIVGVLPWDYEGTVAGVVTAGWHHVALAYDGATYRVFVDGAESFSVAGTMSGQGPTQCVIGSYASGVEPFFHGYLDEVRVTKGVARYTASFTPPTTQFPDN